MTRFNLQTFATAVQGKKIVYLFRIQSKASTEAAWIPAFVTENNRTSSVDADSTATKQGSVRTPGVPEVEITATALLMKGDTNIDALEEAMLAGELIECWEANLEEAGATSGKYKGRYFQGYVTELERDSSAEDMVEVSITYGANGSGVAGDVTVDASVLEAASYVFVDTAKTGA